MRCFSAYFSPDERCSVCENLVRVEMKDGESGVILASWLQRQKLSSLRRLRRCVEECIRSKVLRSSYWRDPLVYSTQQLFWLCLVIFFNYRLKRGEVICSFSVDGSGSVNFRYMSTPLPLCSGVFGVLCTCKA